MDNINKNKIENTILIYIDIETFRSDNSLENDFEEFKNLVISSGVNLIDSIKFYQKKPKASFLISKGKLAQLRSVVTDKKADLVIVNQQLSASQTRNLEKHLDKRVIDKTELILDIFATRAQSHIGKLQVELAQLEHLSTRLIRGWTHLERQKGGIGLRGPGETQLETDRRLIGKRIKRLKQRLEKSHKQKQINRYSRKKSRNKLVALVGYTNAGKTSLFNCLTGSNFKAENKMFATLDSVTRKNIDPEIGPVLFSDTVGFISELPTQLIESFKATLDELRAADLILHVVDVADKDFQIKIELVNKILFELKLHDIPTIIVKNKSDISNDEIRILDSKACYVSAHTKSGIDDLREKINTVLFDGIYEGWISLKSSMGNIRALMFNMGCVLEEKVSDTGTIYLFIRLGNRELQKLISIYGFAVCKDKDILLQNIAFN